MKHIHVINDRDRAIYLLRLLKNLKPLQTKRHQEFLKRLKKDDWAKIGFVDFDRMVKDDLEGMLSGAVEIVSPFEDVWDCPNRPGHGRKRIASGRVGDAGLEAVGDFADGAYCTVERGKRG